MDNSEYIKDKNSNEKMLNHIKSELVFGGSPHSFAMFKKTEKLSTALFLVTQFIPPEEYLRETLRDTSISILSLFTFLRTFIQGRSSKGRDEAAREARSLILKITALLRIARTADYISDMNTEILQKEYIALARMLEQNEEEAVTPRGPIFEQSFFDVSSLHGAYEEARGVQKDILLKTNIQRTEQKSKRERAGIDPGVSKGQKETGHQNMSLIKGQEETGSNAPHAPAKQRKRHHSVGALVRHSKRRESVLTLFKDKPSLSIKDVSSAIRNVSEKTLQRELLAMVSEGILKKEGERRWSTYSLA